MTKDQHGAITILQETLAELCREIGRGNRALLEDIDGLTVLIHAIDYVFNPAAAAKEWL